MSKTAVVLHFVLRMNSIGCSLEIKNFDDIAVQAQDHPDNDMVPSLPAGPISSLLNMRGSKLDYITDRSGVGKTQIS